MELDYPVIFERMLKAGNLRNSSQMAKMLGLTPQAMSSYKRKGAISAGLIFRFASICDVSVDWLLTGEGEVFRPAEGVRITQEVCSIALVERVARGSGGRAQRACQAQRARRRGRQKPGRTKPGPKPHGRGRTEPGRADIPGQAPQDTSLQRKNGGPGPKSEHRRLLLERLPPRHALLSTPPRGSVNLYV